VVVDPKSIQSIAKIQKPGLSRNDNAVGFSVANTNAENDGEPVVSPSNIPSCPDSEDPESNGTLLDSHIGLRSLLSS
jgi:hypothetical protein